MIFLMERDIVGYYFDGKKSWILYQDEYGNETQEEWTDELSDKNGSKEEV